MVQACLRRGFQDSLETLHFASGGRSKAQADGSLKPRRNWRAEGVRRENVS